jgi:hypothetical protein
MTVVFDFQIRDRVINPLGVEGIITMLGFDDAERKRYYVTTATGGEWWQGDQLKEKE